MIIQKKKESFLDLQVKRKKRKEYKKNTKQLPVKSETCCGRGQYRDFVVMPPLL